MHITLQVVMPDSMLTRVSWMCRDKLESEIKKDEKDEKLDGDAALNKLFKDIYGGGDEDTRRAMNKSYQVPPLQPAMHACHRPASGSIWRLPGPLS